MNADRILPCYFAGLTADLACAAVDLAPEEQVIVDPKLFLGKKPLPRSAPRAMTVCAECADSGWNEIEGYATELYGDPNEEMFDRQIEKDLS
jgi:hypothetical protein